MTTAQQGARRRRRALACGIALGLTIVGCSTGGGEDPTPTATAEPSTTTEPTADPTADEPTPWPEPTRPPEMDRDDVEGAKAAAAYFMELYTFAHISGDLAAWSAMSDDECQFCAAVVERVAEVHRDGGYADGPDLEIVDSRGDEPSTDYEFFAVSLDVQEATSSRYDALGNVVDTTQGGPKIVDLALILRDEEWFVRGVVVSVDVGDEKERSG